MLQNISLGQSNAALNLDVLHEQSYDGIFYHRNIKKTERNYETTPKDCDSFSPYNPYTRDDDEYPFWFYALHSRMICFKPGFHHYGDIEYRAHMHVPPRGRWPEGRVWNHDAGGIHGFITKYNR